MKAKAFRVNGLSDPLLMLTEHGDIIWHNRAEQVIDDDTHWKLNDGALRFALTLLLKRDDELATLKGSQLKLIRELTIMNDVDDPTLVLTVNTRTCVNANTSVDNPNLKMAGG